MNISTFKLGGWLKKSALLTVVAVSAVSANAATFLYNGVVWKNSGTKLTAQKATTKPDNGEAPGVYKGDIVIPATIEYDGVTYTVTSIAAVFKASEITSIDIADGVATIGRGGFQDCVNLKSVRLPGDLVTLQADVFSGCTSLEEIVIPGTVKEVQSNTFKNCIALKKITLADGPTALEITNAAFPFDAEVGPYAVEEVVINRAIGSKYTDMDSKPFRNKKSITKVTIGGSCVGLPASYFAGSSKIEEVVFESAFADMGTNLFEGTGIVEITLPESLTAISASAFQGCKKLQTVMLGSAVTSIADMAFYNSTLAQINLPTSLKTIGQMAFSGTNLDGDLVIPEGVTRIGAQAFAKNAAIAAVSLPSTITTIGDGAFMGCSGIASFEVAADNATFQSDADKKYVATKDGKTLVVYAPAAAGTSLSADVEEIAAYAMYGASNIESVSFPNAVKFGDYALSQTGLKAMKVAGEVGRYVLADCAALETLEIDCGSVPFGIASGDAALTQVTLRERTATVQSDAFRGCTSLKELNLGSILAILEADAFAGAGIEKLTVCAFTPAGMADGVFTESSSAITLNVPADLVDKYKEAEGWKYLNIVGDANLAVGPADMGMPAGLYYAGTDGMLHCYYADGNFDTYDVGGVPHTFQLIEFANRIYGASAGQKFVYSATGSVDGDGKLFYISKVGGEIFQATVLDNAGNNAYKDPFGLYIYDETLYVNDRNVCIRKIPASAIALPQSYPSWMENNWMAFYGAPWAYGCIKAGFAITQDEDAQGNPEPLYWVGMKYNGNGIYRFKEENIGTSSSEVGTKPEAPILFNAANPIFTTFFVDEKHQQLYVYIEVAGSNEDANIKGGIYRFELADLDLNPDPSDLHVLNPVLIDGSPVKWEGSATNEHVGIPQFSPDETGEYLYWCYRAPSASEAAANEAQDYTTMKGGKYWWADKYDAENPLHHSGIKRIKLGEAQPTVEMVVASTDENPVEGYGVVPVKFDSSKKPDGVEKVVNEVVNRISVNGDIIAVDADAVIVIYNMAGVMVDCATVAAGEAYSIADMANGAYIVNAKFADGKAQAVKVVK